MGVNAKIFSMTTEEIKGLGLEGVETPEQLTARIAELNAAAAANAELEGTVTNLTTELNTIKPEWEKLKTTPPIAPYKSPIGEWADGLGAKGLDDSQIMMAFHFKNVDVDKMDPKEVVKTAALMRIPGLRPEMVDAEIRTNFLVDPNDTTMTSDEKLLREKRLFETALKDREFIKENVLKATTPKADTAKLEVERRQAELKEFWTGRIPAVVKDLRKIEGKAAYNLPGGKGAVTVEAPWAFEVSDKDFVQFQTNLINDAVRGLLPNTQEGEQQLLTYAKEKLQAQYLPKIQEAERVATNNVVVDFLFKEFNVKAPGAQAGAGGGGAGGTDEERARARQIFKGPKG